MDNYVDTKGYSSRSELLRQAFRIQKQIFPIQSSDSESLSIEEHFRRIEKRLDQITSEQKILKKEENTLKEKEDLLTLEEKEIHEELDTIPVHEIPNFEEISKGITDFIHSFPDKTINDLTLMDHFKKIYPESLLWAILIKLKNRKILKLEKGAWSIYDT